MGCGLGNGARTGGSDIAVRKFEPAYVAEIIRRIYSAEIPGRIEWMFDDGFVWVLVGPNGDSRNLPRVWMDDAFANAQTKVQSATAAPAHERSQFLMRDWLERGKERTIEDAVCALAEAIVRHHEHSEFARWWRELRGTSAA